MALERILKDGSETGATVADKINAIMDAVEALIPKGAMSQLAPTPMDLNDTTYTQVNFDVNVTSRNGVTVDLVDNSITVDNDGVYDVSFGVDSDFSQQEELQIAFFINDVVMPTTPFSLQGMGNGKPNSISWTTTVPLNAGDVLDMRFINGDIGDVTLNIRRMFLSVTLDHLT